MKVILVKDVVDVIRDFLATNNKHLRIWVDEDGKITWDALNSSWDLPREYAEPDIFLLPNAWRRREEDILYTFVTLIYNRTGYKIVVEKR